MPRLFQTRILAPSASEMASITLILEGEGGITDIGIVLTAWGQVYSSKRASDESQHPNSDYNPSCDLTNLTLLLDN